jgi:hypothetical protein
MLPLGDAGGRDRVLANQLVPLRDRLDQDAGGAGGYWLVEWLARCKDPFVWCAAKIPAAVSWAVERFTNQRVALVRAEAEAEKTKAEAAAVRERAAAETEATRLTAAAGAEKTRAEAEVARAKGLAEAEVARAKGLAEVRTLAAEAEAREAEAAKARAVAQALRRETQPAAKLLAEMKRRGIVWVTDDPTEEGVLRVGVRKPRSPSADPPPG